MNSLKKSVYFLPKKTSLAYRQNSTQPFKIPEKIDRSSIALLQALADTVGTDPTAPHFAFIDDPITIPSSSVRKNSYYLAKEYGKRAARQLVEEWPTLFMFDRDQPRLPAFRPEKPLDPMVIEPTEENLQKIIKAKQVEDCIDLYKTCQEKNVEISKDTQLDMFRLFAYYNAKNIPLNEIEEWHGVRSIFGKPPELLKIRHKDGIVNTLFENLEKTEEVYSIMICHLCKFYTEDIIKDVKILFYEMLEKGFKPCEEVFNHIMKFSVKPFEFLQKMNELGIQPSVHTFNVAIKAIAFEEKNQRMILCKKIIREMKLCKINPDLVTFDSLIRVIGNFDKPNELIDQKDSISILNEILNILEKWPLIPMGGYNSQEFFLTAMEVARHTGNPDIADRVYNLCTSLKNHVQLNPFTIEQTFYYYYTITKAPHLTMPELYEFYIKHYPRVATFSKHVMNLFMNTLKNNPYWPLVHRLYADCICDGILTNKDFLFKWLDFWEIYPFDTLSDNELDEFKTIFRRTIFMYLRINLNPRMIDIDKHDVEGYLTKVPFMKTDPEIISYLDSYKQAVEGAK